MPRAGSEMLCRMRFAVSGTQLRLRREGRLRKITWTEKARRGADYGVVREIVCALEVAMLISEECEPPRAEAMDRACLRPRWTFLLKKLCVWGVTLHLDPPSWGLRIRSLCEVLSTEPPFLPPKSVSDGFPNSDILDACQLYLSQTDR